MRTCAPRWPCCRRPSARRSRPCSTPPRTRWPMATTGSPTPSSTRSAPACRRAPARRSRTCGAPRAMSPTWPASCSRVSIPCVSASATCATSGTEPGGAAAARDRNRPRPMPARLTAYLPDFAAASRLLRPPQHVVLGRAEDCDFRLDHPSISRRHAEIWRDGESWRVIDLGSKNGTFIAGARVGSVRLERSGWLRVGDVQCEFETLTPEAADHVEQRQALRRANSLLFAERLATRTQLTDLLQETVRAAVELSECERGFLLLGAPGALVVAARHA